jgi:hypothetical protein
VRPGSSATSKERGWICGGTAAAIVSRELGVPRCSNRLRRRDLPPTSKQEGADLVTEGFSPCRAPPPIVRQGDAEHNDPAGRLVELLRRNDIIEFLVGTRINEAHQDPNLPGDLELRRNIVKRLAAVLRDRYMKEVRISFV